MTKKKVLIIALIGLLIVSVVVGVFMVVQNNKAKEDAQAQKELQYKYFLQSRFFRLGVGSIDDATYAPYREKFINQVYNDLAYYKKNTGKELTLVDIQEYLSQEFEEDGSVRIYDNGKHPEIHEYFEWRMEPRRDKEIDEYTSRLIKILVAYEKENYPEGAQTPFDDFPDMPLSYYDELFKKEADPSYEMQFDFE